MNLSRVTIVVLNWNGADDSLVRLRVYTAPYPLTLIETGRNLGFAEGNNVEIRHTLADGANFV